MCKIWVRWEWVYDKIVTENRKPEKEFPFERWFGSGMHSLRSDMTKEGALT